MCRAAASAPAAAAAGRSGPPNPRELDQLRRENETLVTKLVHTQLELAELSEDSLITKRDLARAKETNLKLAQKLTTLEAQAYSIKAKDKKGAK